MNLVNYLYTPALRIHPDLYLHKNAHLQKDQPQAPPAPLQDHDRKKQNILNMAGEKFISLLKPIKGLKLKQKRADSPIPALLSPLLLEGEGNSTRLYATGRKIRKKYVRGGVQRRDLVGQVRKFQSGLVGTAVNADAFCLHDKRWYPAMEVITEEEEEEEEEEIEGKEEGVEKKQ